MNVERQSLYVSDGERRAVGVGFHNAADVLWASDRAVQEAVKKHYQQRGGHIPLDNVDKTFMLVQEHDDPTTSQFHYLSDITGRRIEPKTIEEIKQESRKTLSQKPLVVPYIKLPLTETYLERELGADVWGLPGTVVSVLKNKAEFHERILRAEIDGLHVPDFIVTDVDDLTINSEEFYRTHVKDLYKRFKMDGYTHGLVLRPAESDGNFGAGVVREENGHVLFMPDGKMEGASRHPTFNSALARSQEYMRSTMNSVKEKRVVVSRLIDLADSPGMSVAVLDGQVISLGWNGQIIKDGTACVGTSTYRPKDEYLQQIQEENEEKTAGAFSVLLSQLTKGQGIDLQTVRGIANIDIMIPGERERELQRKRGGDPHLYVAESNPRYTNMTDGVLTAVAAQRLPQTVRSMRVVTAAGIVSEDKYALPAGVDPKAVRDEIYKSDLKLKEEGTRVIARMTVAPMGVIFLGNTELARRELTNVVHKLAGKKSVI